jgi:poly(3-hydroxybutyrate) depolymerase
MKQGGSAAKTGARRQGKPERPVPTIVFHGDRDTTVNPINGDEVVAQAKASADLRTNVNRGRSDGGMSYTRTVHSDANGRAMLEQWVLHGASHAWSGGSPAGSYTDMRGPDASREMIRFFLQHSTAAAAQG